MHVVVQQKLTQHCKAMILQLKEEEYPGEKKKGSTEVDCLYVGMTADLPSFHLLDLFAHWFHTHTHTNTHTHTPLGPASCVLEAQHRPILSDSGPAAPWSPGVQALLLDATHLPMLPTHLDTSHNQTHTSTASVSKGGDSTVPDWWKTLDITGLTP